MGQVTVQPVVEDIDVLLRTRAAAALHVFCLVEPRSGRASHTRTQGLGFGVAPTF